MKWMVSTLGKTVEKRGLIQTGPFGSQLHQADYVSEGIPVIMPKDIADGQIDPNTVARVTEETAMRLSRHQLRPRSIVLPRRGEVTKRALVREDQTGWLCGTGCLQIVVEETALVPEYLYYFMEQQHVVRWLEQHAVGTTMLNLSASIVSDLPVQYPQRDHQLRIASILSAYDDLVENNRRRMGLLEEAARQLYREWFVRLRFPGHEHARIVNGMPEGWERKRVGDILDRIETKKKIPKNEYSPAGAIPCVDQSAEFIGGYTDDEEARHTSPLPVVVFGDHTRVLKFVNFDFARGADGTQIIYPNTKRLSTEYIYLALLEIDISNYFYARHFKFLKEQEVIVPHERIVRALDENVAPVFAQIRALRVQNHKLRAARDLLLPKLMSGEIAV